MFRFIHSSDLHLGKPFGRYPEDVRVRLRQARMASLEVLAERARASGAGHVLLAGDTFDQMTPAPKVIRDALNATGAASDITWLVLPGNHDHANATELWRTFTKDAPPNVTALLTPEPVALSEDVTLLPAPPTERHPGRDLTEWFNDAATGEALRIGLAHGSIRGFSSEDGGASVLSADRAREAGLAYLGLGDWHGQLKISETTWYSGAPEADSFKHDAAATALLVELDGQGVRVTPQPTAALNWRALEIDLTGEETEISLPQDARSDTLMSLTVTGHAGPTLRRKVEADIAQASPDFLWAEATLDALRLIHDTSDLDQIDRHGALRAAADVLAAEAEDTSRTPEERTTARTALSYLFSYVGED
ncbi:metallophosphoesterase family protein [Gymnodinialimonas ceratoperidinii]|uniref:Metallophosphoesterase n=1 Tax=Gymnodinialimonas ceratoperidinii TaxID=2856823 RepID=A0A8F6YBW0_9RHOB|nr:metallophosphoesterase [Gymnodinialimonas ceratoperidinii]QXT38587.1 metallophosphoesterase [Gymnodinialimonas ceratoperidinii]